MRLSSACSFLAIVARSTGVQGFRHPPIRRNATSSLDASLGTTSTPHLPVAAQQQDAAAHNVSIYDKLPGLWFEVCADNEYHRPCTAYCHKNDTTCQEVGQEAASSCLEIWSTYNWYRPTTPDPESGWSMFYTTYGQTLSLSSTTVDVYTTFSTASVAVVKQNVHTNETNFEVTITPVYALGQPSPSVSVKTLSQWTTTTSWLTAPKPSCRYIALSTSNDCGQCSIHGGSVELYYWPPTTSTSTVQSPITTKSTVLTDGLTLYSPTVYISLSTVYASNSCSQIGQNHTGTLLAMNPEDVSTQIHWGGKVAASGANSYDKINYTDLAGLTPVTDYEMQPSCIMFGCSTIFPTYNPTLVVPLALRTLAPEWADCYAALEGLYDPPIALTEQAVMASPTLPSQNNAGQVTSASNSMHIKASQCSSPIASTPAKTNDPVISTRSVGSDQASDLASLIAGGETSSHKSETLDPATSTGASELHEQTLSTGGPTETEPDRTVQTASFSGPVESTFTLEPSISSERGTKVGGYIASILSLVQHDTTGSGSMPGSEDPQTAASTNPISTTTVPDHHQTSVEGATFMTYSNPESAASYSEAHWPTPKVHQNKQGDFIVNGMTLAPGSPITLTDGTSSMTVKMVTTHGKTLIELGTTRSELLGPSTVSTSTSSNGNNRTAILQSTDLPSLVSPDPSDATSKIESISSTSAAWRIQQVFGAWTVASTFALAVLLSL